jgi:tRNA threonylcarbamoyladenosine biosynthesis protein TsaB
MKILALELSTARGSLAWLNEDVDPAAAAASAEEALFREWPNDRKDSGPFFENLAEVRKQFGLPKKIIVGLGPGSYAGVRIAISTAIGLQVASNAPLVGYPSICALECDEYCVIGDARRQSFFFAHVRASQLMEGPALYSEIELRDKIDKLEANMSIFTSEKLPQFSRAIIRYPSALVLARLAQDSNRDFAKPPLEPIYLREPHITTPKK